MQSSIEEKEQAEQAEQAYRLAEIALSMRLLNPNSRIWRFRARVALEKLEELYGDTDAVL
jgi:hypothetical protein